MVRTKAKREKVAWFGRIMSVQPRIRFIRSFDERYHNYLGYVLCMGGICAEEDGGFIIAIGKAAQARHLFRAGMEASGLAVPVPDPRLETAGFYKASGLKILKNVADEYLAGPPFHGVPPDLETYRGRGHRRLDVRTYEANCVTCIWGCRMPVEMIVDQWNPSQKRYRSETFCYGPKSCAFYRAGPTRKVPGRKGMSYTEEDWVDDDATAHRGPDD